MPAGRCRSAKVLREWLPNLEQVAIKPGDELYEPRVRMQHINFPSTCIVSVLYVMENGDSAGS
jgi:hypothetical protein